ncbi:hypothetical protein F2Q69_00044999 [Brassica cretica]|uniref:Uncharacterized protein n=1 Tax=Brassica cretica TaxID=69181 RepID=A0A8S9NAL7_BRACR|nr:hypothetical protein F2Q69_00044999 [Brassica cretica]
MVHGGASVFVASSGGLQAVPPTQVGGRTRRLMWQRVLWTGGFLTKVERI